MNGFPAWLASTLASDATEGLGVLPNTILPLRPASHVVGPACVVLMSQDDNLAVRKVMEAPPAPGTVLVVAGGSTSRTATIGGLMALEMQNVGIAGLVTDGLVRDSREIRESGFAVWCRGVTPTASKKNGPALVGGSVSIGGTVIRDGDLIIADDDGVVIWPQERIDDLLARAQAKLEQDNSRLAHLQGKKWAGVTCVLVGVIIKWVSKMGMVKIKKSIKKFLLPWDYGASTTFENQQLFPVPFTPKDVIAFAYAHEPFAPGPTLYYALVHEFGRSVVEDAFESISSEEGL